jgi:hypothetical protein
MGAGEDERTRAAGAGDQPACAYFNYMQLRVGLSTVSVDIGQIEPGASVPDVQSYLVTSPDYLLTMSRRVRGAIDAYQAQFGALMEATTEEGAAGHG